MRRIAPTRGRLPLAGMALLMLLAAPLTHAAETAPALAGTWVSILPPALAIGLALTLRQVIPAIFFGVWCGAWAMNGFTLPGLWTSLFDSFQVYVLEAFADRDHGAIILFTLMIGGMVGIVSRNGGMQGIVNRIAHFADSARHACLATASMGMAIFFDDYANTLVVGNTMRPLADAKRVSRAKLAYLVDSTAAPVSCVAVVTTWIGYEVGLLGDTMERIPNLDIEAFLLFLSTLPYSFYPILAIVFVFMIAASGRDFGPMLAAERAARAADPGQSESVDSSMAADCEPIEPIPGKPQRALNAILPIVMLIAGVVGGLYITGSQATDAVDPGLRDIVGAANSYTALMWASLLGAFTAGTLTLAQRIMSLPELVDAWYKGMRSMLYAMIILLLAWSLSSVTEDLETAAFLVRALGDTLAVEWMPALVFILSALTAFATGSSWGAMGILVPLTLPLTWAVMGLNGMQGPEHMHILYSSVAAVLAGSVWGDHCSPISDTTILSSMASGCDHIEHVRTQLPYALTVGATAIVLCSLPVAYGLPWWLGVLVSVGVLYATLRAFGRLVEPAGTPLPESAPTTAPGNRQS
ncbi:Na+/H+ antiporter NhaC family protein [Elongatibacter sediminis]|uniref:Na+/H+ antiporter NhaC family protein n=1 Tax=Elongatibacter sediminis TaxID=3119006 RepID=A0AAW9R742_9GAMM